MTQALKTKTMVAIYDGHEIYINGILAKSEDLIAFSKDYSIGRIHARLFRKETAGRIVINILTIEGGDAWQSEQV